MNKSLIKTNKRLTYTKLLVFIGLLFVVFSLLSVAFSVVRSASASVPQFVNYQSRLRDAGGTAITATTTIQFSIYNDATSGSPTSTESSAGPLLWKETYNQATGTCAFIDPDSEGYFTIQLGTCNAFPGYLDFTSNTLYVGVKIESDSEATPRARLGTAPYSFNADRVDGLHATSFVRTDATSTIATSTADTILTITQSGTGDILNLFDGSNEVLTVLDGGNVGIGTSSPAGTLHVANASSSNALVVASSGRVGIGISTPSTALHVIGDITASAGLSFVNATGTTLTLLDTLVTVNLTTSNLTATGTLSADVVNATTSLVSSGTLTVSGQSSLTSVSSTNLEASGALIVSGSSSLQGLTFVNATGTGNLQAATLNITSDSSLQGLTFTNATGTSLALTALTAGSVPFIGTGGIVSQDNANLFWDDTNNRLGIGTSSPARALDVTGFGKFGLSGEAVIGDVNGFAGFWISDPNGSITPTVTNYAFLKGNGNTIFNTPSGENIDFRVDNVNQMTLNTSGGLGIGDSYANVDPGDDNVIIEGNLGVGTTSPSVKLSVVGTSKFQDVTFTNATGTGNFQAATLTITGQSSLASVSSTNLEASGDFTVGGQIIGTVSGQNALTLSGAPQESASTALFLLGPNKIQNANASGTFIGANPVTFNGNFIDFQVNSSTVFKVNSAGVLTLSTLDVTNVSSTNVSSTNITASGSISGGSLSVSGQSDLASVSSTNLEASGTLTIAGGTSLQGTTFTNATGTGNLQSATLNITGQTTLANASSTNFEVSGTLTVGGTTALQDFTFANATGTGNLQLATLVATGASSLQEFTFTNATGTGNLQVGALTVTGSTTLQGSLTASGQTSLASVSSTNLEASGNLTVGGTSALQGFTFTNATGTGNLQLATLVATDLSSLQDLTFANATGTGNLQAATLMITGQTTLASASSTNLEASGTGLFPTLSFTNASGTNLTASGFLQGGTLNISGQSSLASVSSTNIEASGLLTVGGQSSLASVSSTNLEASGNLTVGGISALQGVTFTNATGTALALSGFTQGSVLFAGANGVISQDNTNLFWDDTNNRLGIGTSTPSEELHVFGSGVQRITIESSDQQAGIEFISDSADSFIIFSPNDSADLAIWDGSSTIVTFQDGGNVGIGTSSPATALHVIGDITASGNLNFTSLSATNGTFTGTLSADMVNATTSLVSGGTLSVTGQSSLGSVSSTNLEASGVLTVAGVSGLQGVTFTNATGTGNLQVATLVATGLSSLQDITFTNATGTGNLQAATLTITGQTSLASASSTNLESSGRFTFVNASGTNLTTSGFLQGGSLNVSGVSALQSLTFTNATGISLALTALTAGSVPFIGTGGIISQDNSNLFWDDTNNRLGVGTASPDSRIHINGGDTSTIYPTTTSTGNIVGVFQNGNQWIEVGTTGATNDRRAWIIARHSNVASFGNFFSTLHLQPDLGDSQWNGVAIGFDPSTKLTSGQAGTAAGLVVGGQVGIGTTQPSSTLHVIGDITASGNLNFTSLSATNGTFTGTLSGDVVNATSSLVSGGTLSVTGQSSLGSVSSTNLESSGVLTVGGTSGLQGVTFTNATGTGNLQAATLVAIGLSSLQDMTFANATGTGNLQAATLTITGQTSLASASSTNLEASGNLTVGSDSLLQRLTFTNATGTANLQIATLVATGASSLQGFTFTNATGTGNLQTATFTATGQSSLASVSSTNLEASGTLTVGGTSALQGITFANATGTGNLQLATLLATGAVTFQSTLDITGQTTLTSVSSTNIEASGTGLFPTLSFTNASGTNLTASGFLQGATLAISGQSSFASVSSTNLEASGSLTVGGTSALQGLTFVNATGTGSIQAATLNITGNSSLQGLTFTNATGTGNLQATTLNITGQTTLASASSTNLEVSGTLTVGGTSALQSLTFTNATGTSLALTALTAGSVPFIGTGGIISQDNTNFFWDDTNNRLGIGTSSPAGTLHVSNASATAAFVVTSAGQVGIGTTTPATALHVIGDITASGNLNFTSLSATDGTFTGTLSADTVNATTSLVSGGTLSVTGSTTLSSLTASGQSSLASASSTNLEASGVLTVGGSTSLQGLTFTNATGTGNLQAATLTITGQTTLASASSTNIEASGVGTFATLNFTNASGTNLTTSGFLQGGSLNISGQSSLASVSSTNLEASGVLTVGGQSNLQSASSTNLESSGQLTFVNASGTNLTASGFLQSAGTLAVTGQSSLASVSSTNLEVSGTLTVGGTSALQSLTFTNATGTGNLQIATLVATGLSSLQDITFANATGTGNLQAATLTITGSTTLNSLTVNGQTTLASASSTNFEASGALTIAGTSGLQGLTFTNATGTSLALTALTAGSVPFIGTGGIVSQDNANLFFDDTNNRLGIGTSTPATALHVIGDITASGALTISGSSILQGLTFTNATGTGNLQVATLVATGLSSLQALTFTNATGTTLALTGLTAGSIPFIGTGGIISQDNANFFWDDTNNRLGIGTSTPDNLLDIYSASGEAVLALTSLGSNTDAALKFQLANGTANFTIGVDDSDGDKFKISTIALGTSDRLVLDSLDSSLFADTAASESATGTTGAVGGALTATAGVGAEVTGGSGSTGGIGGALTLTAGAGGRSTVNNQSDFAGAGGAVALTAGAGGGGGSGITPGVGGVLTLTAGAGGGGVISIGSDGGIASLVGGAGGNSDGNNLFAGAGGATNVIGGAGGGADAAGGGAGGTLTITAGVGGAGGTSAVNGTGGAGGNLVIDSGAGGTAGGTGTAGTNGTISIGASNASAINSGSSTLGTLWTHSGALTISGSSTLQGLTFVNATGTGNVQAATLNITGQTTLVSASSTNIEASGSLTIGGTSALQGVTFTNATGTGNLQAATLNITGLSSLQALTFTNATGTTLALTGLTAGSIPFIGTGGIISQDNSNLFWDDTNNRLGIGTSTPDNLLDIYSASGEAVLALTSLGSNTDAALKFQLANGTANFTIGVDDSDGDKFKISTTGLGTSNFLSIDSAAGGTFTLATQNESAAAAGQVGGALTLTAGNAGDTSSAGAGVLGGGITLTTGAGGVGSGANVGGAGGALTLLGGTGGQAGDAANIGGAGGALLFQGGQGSFTAGSGAKRTTGGAVTVQGGDGGFGQQQGPGGAVNILGGNAIDTGNVKGSTGGAVTISGGNVLGTSTLNNPGGTGGSTSITGGRGGDGGGASNENAGTGGALTLTGGTGGDTATNGNAGAGGNITIDAGVGGVASGTGSNGANGTISIGISNALTINSGSSTAATLWTHSGRLTVTATTTFNTNLVVDTNTFFVDSSNNRVGIGTTTPATTLHVIGDITASGNLNFTNLSATNGTFTGMLSADVVNATSSLVSGGTLSVTGSTTLSSLTASGQSSLASASSTNLEASGTLTIGGNSSLQGLTFVNATGTGNLQAATLTITGSTTLNSLTVNGQTTLASASSTNFEASGALTIAGTSGLQGLTFTNATGTSLALTALTAGSVPFIGTGGIVSQDNANLFFDDTNNRLGIGTSTPATALHVIGDITASGALTISGSSTLQGTFLQTPGSPVKVGGEALGNFVNAVYVSGNYAYVGLQKSGNREFEIVDISDPTNPTEVSSGVEFGVNANAVYVSGNYAYVGTDGNRLEVIDISNPTSPTNVGDVVTADAANAVYVSGKYAYVGSDATGDDLEIFDISDPTNPTKVGGAAAADAVNAIYVSGNYAYVGTAATGDDLEIFDISDPSNPTKVGGAAASSSVNAVYVSGRYAYVGSDATGDDLEVFDVSNPASPTKVGGADAADGVNAVYVSGRYAYVGSDATGDDLEVFDISDPTNPTKVGGVDADSVNAVYVSGRYAYVGSDATGDDLEVFDLGGIDSPAAHIGDISASTIDVTENVDIGNNLYVRNGLNIGPGGIYTQGPSTFYASTTVAASTAALTIIQNSTGDILNILDGTTEVLTILDGGNVGIGTSSPATALHVIGDITASDFSCTDCLDFTELSDTLTLDAQTTINLGDNNFQFQLTVGGGDFKILNEGGSPAFTVRDVGDVGIGVFPPDTRLHVSDGSAGAVSPISGTQLTIENSAASYLSFLTPDASERGIYFGEASDNDAGGIIYNNASTLDGFQFRTNGNTTRMVIDANGNVGIGTTTPATALHVIGDITASGALTISGSSTLQALTFTNATGTTLALTGLTAGSVSFIGTGGIISEDNANFFWDDTNNRLGIGTTTPAGTLHVSNASSSNALVVAASGNVGIGTAAPANILVIQPTTNADKILLTESDSNLAAIQLISFNGGGQLTIAAGGNTDIILNALGTTVFNEQGFSGHDFRIEGDTNENLFFVDASADKVGIGTTNPTAELEVVGDIISQGTAWTSRTSAADNSWNSVAYGNGLFVAVSSSGTGNRVMTSPDGINWTSQTSAADNGWFIVTYGDGLFVAISNSGVMTSPDGITWTSRTSPTSNAWNSVTYGNGLFVAVSGTGTGDRVMTSPDGITWTSQTSAADNNWISVTYGNGLFVAVSIDGTGDRVMTSPDGITWTSQTSAADNGWFGVTYGNGLFVAVSVSGTGDRVMTSPDGINWTSSTSAADNSWRFVTYGNGLFVAVSSDGTDRVMTSPDGITWTSRTSAPNNSWFGVTYGNGLFVAVSTSGTGDRVMTSGKTERNIVSTNNIFKGGMSIFGNVGIGTVTPGYTLEAVASADADGFRFFGFSGTTGERDMFIIEDPDAGGGSQDESASFKVHRTGAFSAADDGSSLVELTYTGVTADADEQFYILGRTTDEGAVKWGISMSDSDFWTTGAIRGGATGVDCAGTNAPCFNSAAFQLSASGDSYLNAGNVGIGDTSPDFLLDVAGTFGTDGNVTLGDASGDSVTFNASTLTFTNDTAVTLSGGINGLNFDSNTLSIDAANNRVGIGTASPTDKLEVVGNVRGDRFIMDRGGTQDSYIQKGEVGTKGMSFYTVGSHKMTISEGGNVGIGTSTPSFRLEVAGTVAFTGLTTQTIGATASICQKNSANGFELTRNTDNETCLASSLRFKKNIETLSVEDGLQTLLKFRPVSFEYKDPDFKDIHYGLIAEEVEKINPKLVSYGEDGLPYTVKYISMIPVLVQSIQELDSDIRNPNSLYLAENDFVGIGTSTPALKLHVEDAAVGSFLAKFVNTAPDGDGIIIQAGPTSTPGADTTFISFRDGDGDEVGSITGSGDGGVVYNTTGADYAEYFFTHDTDLVSGEVVCVDVGEENAVQRCREASDGNVMGIVSTAPAFVGNATAEKQNNPNYVMVAMLGQIPANVSIENGPVRVGDSLTSAYAPGYVMKANAGDPTVAIALESLGPNETVIQVLISRRNKSLTVETVEQEVLETVAAMEIEDEVEILIASAVENLNLDQDIATILNAQLATFDLHKQQDFAALASSTAILIDTVSDQKIQLTLLAEFIQGVSANLTIETLTVSNAVFDGEIVVKGHVTLSSDSVGQAKVLAGDTSVQVNFVGEYENPPIITATMLGLYDIIYGINHASTTGFAVEISPVQERDVIFNWHAFAADEQKIHVSDGTVSTTTITVVYSEPVESVENPPEAVTIEVNLPQEPPVSVGEGGTESQAEESTLQDASQAEETPESDTSLADTDEVAVDEVTSPEETASAEEIILEEVTGEAQPTENVVEETAETSPVQAPILSPTESEEQNRESSISEPNQDDLVEIGKEIVTTTSTSETAPSESGTGILPDSTFADETLPNSTSTDETIQADPEPQLETDSLQAEAHEPLPAVVESPAPDVSGDSEVSFDEAQDNGAGSAGG